MKHDRVELAMRLLQEAAQDEVASEPRSLFRIFCGVFLGFLAIVFLGLNTWQLGEYGMKFGADDSERWRLALLYGTVPWGLALFAFLLPASWIPAHYYQDHRGRTKRRRGRPSAATLGILLLYLVFVSVNVIGGVGALSTERAIVTGKATDAKRETDTLVSRKKRLEDELAGVKTHRPLAELESLLSRQQQHRFWKDTDSCSTKDGAIAGRAQRNFCSDYDLLAAELGRAKEGARIRSDLTAVEKDLAAPGRSAAVAMTAQTSTLAYVTGYSESTINAANPLLVIVMLELGSIYFAWQALALFGVSHRVLSNHEHLREAVPPSRQLAPPSQIARALQAVDADAGPVTATPKALIVDDPVRQRAVFDEFWRSRMRRVDSGQVALPTVYSHYEVLCAQRSVTPFDQSTFKRLSATHVRAALDIGGVEFWCHVTIAEG